MYTMRHVVSGSAPAPTPIGAKLLKTGQTVSYRSKDDGDIEAGRDVSFFTLLGNNPYGNTKRFLDELGTEVFTNKIAIDWSTYDGSTVLGYKISTNGSVVTWNNAVDGAAAVSIGTYTSGWRLPNVIEMINLCNYGSASGKVLNYAPINITDWVNLWTSTTNVETTTNAMALFDTRSGAIAQTSKAGAACHYIAVRNFTVTGTTLT